MSIADNDTDEAPYDFVLNAVCTGVPEMELKDPEDSGVPDGGSFSFADTWYGASTEATFTIENLGTAALSLTGTPKVAIGGTHASQFTVTAQPSSPVAKSGSTTFTVRFTPTSTGAKSASVSIACDDADESPYDFDLSATGAEWRGIRR